MKKTKFEGLSARLGRECLHTLVEIAGPNTPNQVHKPELEDDQKRWLIVGICLHKVISPILRKYVQSEVDKLFQSLCGSDNINSQVYSRHLKRYKPTNRELNYEAINNNGAIPKLKGGKNDVKQFNYKVTSDVDFSKLFLVTHMTHYTGFDETCDMSALLGIIINIDTFPAVVKHAAEKLRSEVRNTWAHCNFQEWTVQKYQDSFQRFYQIVKNLQLPRRTEANHINEINDWNTNGIHLLYGTTIDVELFRTLKSETRFLSTCIADVVIYTDDCNETIRNAISVVEDKIEKSENAIARFSSDIDIVKETQSEQGKDIQVLKTDLEDVTSDVTRLKKGHEEINQNVSKIEEDIADIKAENKNTRAKLDENTLYMSSIRPCENMFFYPPNRVPTFIGRENELFQLHDILCEVDESHHLVVICGLGGAGKTSLAIEYSWQYQNIYQGGVYWMSAESNEALEDALHRLAMDINAVGENSRDTLRMTLKWIASLQEKWLLIIDNLDQDELYGNIKELVYGSWQRVSNAHIIITSRRSATQAGEDFKVRKEVCITLDVLSHAESIQVLKLRSEMQAKDDSDLEALADELGGLPLALEQAAAHIKVLKCTYSAYLEKFRKKRVQFLRTNRSIYTGSKSRQAVYTTWQLNFDYVSRHSEDEGLKTSAVTVMEIAAFLYPDEIPLEILNSGSPLISDKNLVECFSDDLGAYQVIEVLTRFSLFQASGQKSFSVHRLVQEVIRDNICDDNRRCFVLGCAAKMIHKALVSNKSPCEVLKEANVGRTSLQLWSKLALNANSIRKFMFGLCTSNPLYESMCRNIETVKILQASAVYHSVFQRQDEALEAQDHMLKLLVAIDVPDSESKEIIGIKIPLLSKDRTKIQNCIMAVVKESNASKDALTLDQEALRVKGNEAFKQGRYHESIQYYTEAINTFKENTESRLFSNRSLAYLKSLHYEKAYSDANNCIEVDPSNCKAYLWKAYAIAELLKLHKLPSSWESTQMAAAAVACHLDIQCLQEPKLKIVYPIVKHKVIDNVDQLKYEFGSESYTTLLLKRGRYPMMYQFTSSVQIIGIENGVEIICKDESFLLRKPQMNVYFENVVFPEDTAQISVYNDVNATFYRCRFSNGRRGCEYFPNCDGQVGCVSDDPSKCKTMYEKAKITDYKTPVGEVGNAGIVVADGGRILIDKCVLERCGGSGALSYGENSNLIIKRCDILRNRQMGVESRNGGFVEVDYCTISKNQIHGIAIGPYGRGRVTYCTIQANKGEGLWCGGDKVCTGDRDQINCFIEGSGSTCCIWNNVINQNGMSGVSLIGGSYFLHGNRIFENWLWGVSVQLRSTTNFEGNDVFDNKCGGVWIGINYSAPITFNGNTIRDHSGPAIYSEALPDYGVPGLPQVKVKECMKVLLQQIDNEVDEYSIPPSITSHNIITNNNAGQQHPQKIISSIQGCCFCHCMSTNLWFCGNCKKAQYCSKPCQEAHWLRHKHICKLFRQKFIVEIDLSKTKTVQEMDCKFINIPTGKLPGYRQGNMPDKNSRRKFIVKIQSGPEYTDYDPNCYMKLYDQSQKFEIMFQNSIVYHLIIECGVLAASQISSKKIFCYASFKDHGKTLCLHTDNLAPMQTW